MIERYSITASPAKIEQRFGTDVLDTYAPNFNAAPTQLLPGNYCIVLGRFYILLGYLARMGKK